MEDSLLKVVLPLEVQRAYSSLLRPFIRQLRNKCRALWRYSMLIWVQIKKQGDFQNLQYLVDVPGSGPSILYEGGPLDKQTAASNSAYLVF